MSNKKTRRRRRVGCKASLLEESAVLRILDEEGIKDLNYYKLVRAVLAHEDTLSLSWDDLPWDDPKLQLPKRMREVLEPHIKMFSTKVVGRFESIEHGNRTTKLLVELHDGERVEAVVMQYANHSTVCVSSQVGCKMACTFCATGTMGIIGNLSAAEILEQLVHANAVQPVRNVVFMGMGEPLNNYDAVIAAARGMTDRRRWALRAGHITVSTVGVIPSMLKLTRDMPGISFALSLHAPSQEIREKIVPTASAYPLPKLMAALDNHLENCKKKTVSSVAAMIEYILISDVNDRDEDADLLGDLLRGRNVMVNLIPYNESPSYPYKAPSKDRIDTFQQRVIASSKLIVRVRRIHGSDIAGACGQLALTATSSMANNSTGASPTDIEDLMAVTDEYKSSVGGSSSSSNSARGVGRVRKSQRQSSSSGINNNNENNPGAGGGGEDKKVPSKATSGISAPVPVPAVPAKGVVGVVPPLLVDPAAAAAVGVVQQKRQWWELLFSFSFLLSAATGVLLSTGVSFLMFR